MKQALLGCAILLSLSIASNAQETVGAPYNPDSNADSLISVPDILSIIPLFGQEFLPSEDDLDSTNEIQSLYISNDTLYLIPNGGFILLGDIAPQINLDSLVSSLSVDSTFLANVGGIGSGGCDYHFPDGYYGQGITSEVSLDNVYTVPEGKRLYLTSWRYGDPILNDLPEAFGTGGDRPLMLNGGETLSTTHTGISLFNGVLVDQSSSVMAVSQVINSGEVYSVPVGMRLYITRWRYGDPILAGQPDALPLQVDKSHLLNSGETVGTTSGTYSMFNGYLVEEGYFADCGGSNADVNETSTQTGSVLDDLILVTSIECIDAGINDSDQQTSESCPEALEDLCSMVQQVGWMYGQGQAAGEYPQPEHPLTYPFGTLEYGCYPNWRKFRISGHNLDWVQTVNFRIPQLEPNSNSIVPANWTAPVNLESDGSLTFYVAYCGGICQPDLTWPSEFYPVVFEQSIMANEKPWPFDLILYGAGKTYNSPLSILMSFP